MEIPHWLRLASVSPALLDVYAEDGMTLDQLMAFSVSPNHERQDQVWEAIQRPYNKEPYQIRRLLTEGAVRAADKRALYAGEDYVQAGGAVIRDLFQPDDGGWLQDVALLDRLVAEKLERDARAVAAEGWKWIEVAPEFPYGSTYGMRVISSQRAPLSEEEIAKVEALRAHQSQIMASRPIDQPTSYWLKCRARNSPVLKPALTAGCQRNGTSQLIEKPDADTRI